MGIYVKGMEMPKNCAECPVSMETCKRGYKYLLEHPELYEKRADDCPIVEVKAPHGRLIDADAIGYAGIEKAAYDSLLIVKEQNKLCEDLELLERANGRLDGVLRITSKLRFAPTIIPAEED